MGRCRCDPISVAGCQCSLDDSNCIDITGAGSAANPFKASPILDTSAFQLLSCGASGLLAELPDLYREPPCVKVYSSVSQAIPGPLVQLFIDWTGTEYDTAGFFDKAADDTQITIPVDGIWDIRFMLAIGVTSTDTLYLAEVVKNVNGATVSYDKKEVNNVPNIGTRLHNATDVQLVAGDRLGLRVEHGSATTMNTITDGALGVMMSAIWRRPLPTT